MTRLALLPAILLMLAGVGALPARGDPGEEAYAEARKALSEQRFRQADAHFATAAARAREAGDAAREADALLGRSQCLDALGDLYGYREVTEELLAVQRRLGQVDAAWRTEADLGAVLGLLGNPARAAWHLGRAVAAFEEAGDAEALVRGLAMLVPFRVASGDLRRALQDAERAVHLGKERLAAVAPGSDALPGAIVDLAHAYSARAHLSLEVHDGSRAAEDLREGLTLLSRLTGVWRMQAELKASLATALALARHDAELEEPRQVLIEVLDEYQRQGDPLGSVPPLLALAEIESRRGDHGAAQRHLQQARSLAPAEGAAALDAILGLSTVLRLRGKHAEAVAHAAEARALAAKIGDPRRIERALTASAEVALAAGDAGAALDFAQAAARAEARLDEGEAEEHFLASAVFRGELTDVGVEAALRKRRLDHAVAFLERGRAAGLLDSLGEREALRQVQVAPELLAAYWKARERHNAARHTTQAAREEGRREAIREALGQEAVARAEYLRFSQAVQRELHAGSRVRFAVAQELEPIQRVLRPGEALVLYEFLPARLVAVVVTKAGARAVDLAVKGAAAAVGEGAPAPAGPVTLGDLAALIERLERGGQEAPTEQATADLAKARAWLLDALRLGPEVHTLLLSPDGALAQVPFPALLALDPEAAGRRVVLVPSGSVHALLLEAAGLRGRRTLAVADPLYTARQVEVHQTLTRGDATLAPLLHAQEEVAAFTTETDRRLLGPEATEERFVAALSEERRWRAIHFCCHGLIDYRHPQFSALAITPGETSDGFLSPIEIMHLRMPADLVVLSACSTGLGPTRGGEGVLGFVRAFFVAEAARVLVSLWKVDDEATKELMVRFYAAWSRPEAEGGGDVGAALRAAQDHVRREPRWAHPYYWAAWVHWGLP